MRHGTTNQKVVIAMCFEFCTWLGSFHFVEVNILVEVTLNDTLSPSSVVVGIMIRTIEDVVHGHTGSSSRPISQP
jgi:hypothetical protein